MVLTVAVLQLLVIYFPPMQSFFSTAPLSPLDLGIALGIGVIVFAAIEIEKKWSLL
jgi:Ca2+-transporting ATPase